MESVKGKSHFIDILKKVYDTECRVNAVFCRIALNIHSLDLRKRTEEYLEHNGMTIGKIHILFHLLGIEIQAKENKVVTQLLDSLPATPSHVDRNRYDSVLTKLLLNILHNKIYNCTTLIAYGANLKQKQVIEILKEIQQYERKAVVSLSHVTGALVNGASKGHLPRTIII
jgi:ferritin-like metal-binding protein YciE